MRKHKHTRYPLCRGSLDDAAGTIHIKDLIGPEEQESVDLKVLARPVERLLDLRLVRPGVSTLSGFLTSELGRLPRVADRLRLEEVEAEVLEVQYHRASRVRLTVIVDDESGVGVEVEGPTSSS